MAVSDNYEIVEVVGDSSTDTFSFPFRCRELSDLVVEYTGSDGETRILVDGTDYLIQTSFDNTGGVVLYPKAKDGVLLTSDETLRIYRDTPADQTAKEFRCPHEYEAAFDKDILLIQEAKAMSELAIKKIEAVSGGSSGGSSSGETVVSMAIRPQTIVKGAVGSIPDGWEDGWCDKPALHMVTSGSSELTISAGLQVAAGVEGMVVLSNELESDTVLDVSSAVAQTSGTFYTYADVGSTGALSFGYSEIKPQVSLQSVTEGDFYNTSSHTHCDKDGNALKRVYIGEFVVYKGVAIETHNYQHGTTCTQPVNDGITLAINRVYSLNKPYLGAGSSQVRIYAEDKWGKPGFICVANSGGQGVQSNFTEGVLSVVTGKTHINPSTANNIGGEFNTLMTSALAKVTVVRDW